MRQLNPRPYNTPNEIIAAARQVFFEKGFDETTIEDIREASKLKTFKSILSNFHIKRNIYDRVIQDYAERMEKNITGSQDITQFFLGLNRFFDECKMMGCPSKPISEDVRRDIVLSVANKAEETLQALLQEKDPNAVKMAVGAIERTAFNIMSYNRELPLGVPIYRLTVDLAECVMQILSFTEDLRLHILESLLKQAVDRLEENRMYPDDCTGKEYTPESLTQCIRKLSLTADIVRVVDPGPCRVLILQDNGKITDGGQCHGFWYRDDRISDCVSKDCMRDNQCHEKDEELDGYSFHITSVPIKLQRDDGTVMKCAIEYIKARKVASMVQ